MQKQAYTELMLERMEARVTNDLTKKYNMDIKDQKSIKTNVSEYSRRKQAVAEDLSLQISHLRTMARNPEAHAIYEPKRMKHPLVEKYTEEAIELGISKVETNSVNMAKQGFWRRQMLERIDKKKLDHK